MGKKKGETAFHNSESRTLQKKKNHRRAAHCQKKQEGHGESQILNPKPGGSRRVSSFEIPEIRNRGNACLCRGREKFKFSSTQTGKNHGWESSRLILDREKAIQALEIAARNNKERKKTRTQSF